MSLREGENVVAVEVHVPTSSTVISFNSLAINQANAAIYTLNSTWTYSDKGYRPADLKMRQILGVPGKNSVPLTMSLQGNYPNPFNPTTTIRYSLSQSANVKVEIFDVLGRRIAVLVDEHQNIGTYDVKFNAQHFASGIYFVRMRAGEYNKIHKMTLLK